MDELLASGSVNDRKSDTSLRPCPKYVIDGSPGGKNVQVMCLLGTLIDVISLFGAILCTVCSVAALPRHVQSRPVEARHQRAGVILKILCCNAQCVVSACAQATTLVTVIDKDTDWSATCYCP